MLFARSKPIVLTCPMDASLEWRSTPPLWHTKAVGGRPPHQPRMPPIGPPAPKKTLPRQTPKLRPIPHLLVQARAPAHPHPPSSDHPPPTPLDVMAHPPNCLIVSATPDRTEEVHIGASPFCPNRPPLSVSPGS